MTIASGARRLRVALVAAAMVAATLVGVAAPASAHGSRLCSYMPTGAGNEVRQGGVLKLDDVAHAHDIRWLFWDYQDCAGAFPTGGRIDVAVRFLVPTANGCTTQRKYDTPWKSYDDVTRVQTLAEDVVRGTCYRLIWRATNVQAMFEYPRGALVVEESR
ncbi:MAG TPA: hypothetical protein VI076_01890 [Actinopolymorphaceae bacterium]